LLPAQRKPECWICSSALIPCALSNDCFYVSKSFLCQIAPPFRRRAIWHFIQQPFDFCKSQPEILGYPSGKGRLAERLGV